MAVQRRDPLIRPLPGRGLRVDLTKRFEYTTRVELFGSSYAAIETGPYQANDYEVQDLLTNLMRPGSLYLIDARGTHCVIPDHATRLITIARTKK